MRALIKEYVKELERRLNIWEQQEKISFKHFMDNTEKRDMIMYNMLVCIQSVIDIGSEIIKEKNLETPSSYKEIFDILRRHKLLTKDIAEDLEKLAGFRNVLAHLYWKIDFRRVYLTLKFKRKILEDFYKHIIKRIR